MAAARRPPFAGPTTLLVAGGAVGAALGGRFGRRAALRAGMAAALARVVVGAFPRWPASARRAATSTACVIGGALEMPAVAPYGGAVLVAGTARGWWPSHPPTVATAVLIGGACAAMTKRLWPVAPRSPARAGPVPPSLQADPEPTGEGLAVVVNRSAGSGLGTDPGAQLRQALPDARIIEVDDPGGLPEALEEAAAGPVLGVAGGDGTINVAATVADRRGKPLVVVPTGTLNHLARDLGLEAVDDAVEAVRSGEMTAVDLATIDGHLFLNTASFGSYAELVDARERLEATIGKWPAVLVALARVLRRARPVSVEIDGKDHSLWMAFVGNCRYHPTGFAPAWRERLDDGTLDVRLVLADHPWSRLRLVAAVLTGRLGTCRAYREWTTESLRVRTLGGPLRLARDGETFDGSEEFVVEKTGRRLAVFVPRR